jgi:hypothetical protein
MTDTQAKTLSLIKLIEAYRWSPDHRAHDLHNDLRGLRGKTKICSGVTVAAAIYLADDVAYSHEENGILYANYCRDLDVLPPGYYEAMYLDFL